MGMTSDTLKFVVLYCPSVICTTLEQNSKNTRQATNKEKNNDAQN